MAQTTQVTSRDMKTGKITALKVKSTNIRGWAENKANEVGGNLEFLQGKITFCSTRKEYTVSL